MKDPFELNAKSIMALYELFPTEEACIKHLEAINWHGKLFHHLTRPLKFIN